MVWFLRRSGFLSGMRAAVFGPLCKDRIVIGETSYSQSGGVTYYTGGALASLGVKTVLYGSCYGQDYKSLKAQGTQVVPLRKGGTLQFTNRYSSDDLDERVQEADVFDNEIRREDIRRDYFLKTFDAMVLGPLFHDNISSKFVSWLSGFNVPLVLAAQGMIRYKEDEAV